MKKNFFKKLASVLSLALVVTTVAPYAATSADAAAAPNLAKRYVNVYEGTSYSYAASNAKGYTVKWSVTGAGASYASLTKATGTSTALRINTKGAAAAKNKDFVVRASFYNGNKLVRTAGDSVKIKVSATGVAIKTDADVNAVPAGVATKFSRVITPANSTSVTYWSVTDKDGAATADATIDKVGNLTPNKPGDYKVVAEVKNAANGKVITSATQEVKVVNKLAAVSQKSLNTINATFTGVLDEVKTTDFTVTNASSLIKQAVKSVTLSADKKTVYVELFTDLVNEKTYDVAYGDTKLSFVANAGAPASITVTGKEITFNEATSVDVKLFDANNIDVTSPANMARVNVTTDKGLYTGGKLTLYSVGDVANVKAVYHTYTYGTDGKEVVLEATATFKAVVKANAELTTLTGTVVKSGDTANWKTTTNVVALGDVSYKLVAKAVYADKTEKFSTDLVNPLTFQSTDDKKLIVAADGTLLPVATGLVPVIVKSGDTVLGTIDVTVGAKRVATMVQLDKPSITLSNGADAADVQKVKITVKDQYGIEMLDGANNADVAKIPVTATYALPSVTGREVTFTGTDYPVAGTYQFKVTYLGLSQVVKVIVRTPNTTVSPSSIRVTLSDTEKDIAFASGDTVNVDVDVDLFSYDAANVKVAKLTAAEYTYDVKKSNGTDVVTNQAMTVKFNLRSAAGSVITQIEADTYTIIVKKGGAVVDTATVKVTNTQSKPVVSQKGNQIAANTLDEIKKCFEAKIDGTAIEITNYSADVVGKTVLVKTITVPQTIGGYTINNVVTVNAVVYTP